MKVKFTIDRGSFKKDQVVEIDDELAKQLMGTGKEGSVVEAGEEEKPVSRNQITKQIKAELKAKAEKLKAKAKALKEAKE